MVKSINSNITGSNIKVLEYNLVDVVLKSSKFSKFLTSNSNLGNLCKEIIQFVT